MRCKFVIFAHVGDSGFEIYLGSGQSSSKVKSAESKMSCTVRISVRTLDSVWLKVFKVLLFWSKSTPIMLKLVSKYEFSQKTTRDTCLDTFRTAYEGPFANAATTYWCATPKTNDSMSVLKDSTPTTPGSCRQSPLSPVGIRMVDMLCPKAKAKAPEAEGWITLHSP